MVDISLLVTLHDEAEQAQPSLLSAKRAREYAERRGLSVELVLALDRASVATQRVVGAFARAPQDKVLHLDFGDVGASRNAAVGACRGRYVAICDGDDMLSENFLAAGAQLLDADPRELIARPELVVRLDQETSVGWQVASDDVGFDPNCLLVVNPWTSACMAPRMLFDSVPYWVKTAHDAGLGFEDWHWNCETLARGAGNIVAPCTIHYVRIKATGSMNARSIGRAALMPPSRLFETLQ